MGVFPCHLLRRWLLTHWAGDYVIFDDINQLTTNIIVAEDNASIMAIYSAANLTGVPITVSDDVLNIAAGANIRCADGFGIVVNSGQNFAIESGTLQNPTTFKSSSTTPSMGSWKGISYSVSGTLPQTDFVNIEIRDALAGITFGSGGGDYTINLENVKFSNCTFSAP